MKKFDIKNLGKLFPIIGIILFIYIIISLGTDNILDAFIKIPIQYYLLALVPIIPRLIVSIYSWQYICKKQKMNFKFFYLMKIYLISLFYGNVTPLGIGWHIRIFYLRKKKKVSIEKCLTNSLINISTGLIASLFLALVGSIVFFKYIPGVLPIILLVFLFSLTAFFVFMKKSGGEKFISIFIRPLIPKKYRDRVDKSIESLYEDIPRFRDMIFPFFLEMIVAVLLGTQVYIIALAFSITIPFHMFILISILALIATAILPISIGGLGVREGAFMYMLYVIYGVEYNIAFVISLSGYFVKMLIPSILGAAFSFRKNH